MEILGVSNLGSINSEKSGCYDLLQKSCFGPHLLNRSHWTKILERFGSIERRSSFKITNSFKKTALQPKITFSDK